ncbi:MAG: DNA repair protein RecN [Magnetococcales bacterium]|nr:DNA repair protein RecN [Magnetococcales bacterium]MBF0156178.1 DNA repair protein RecN [Magnetococcales bacterium]
MLCQLTVENIALIERLDLTLEPGLTVITGETGAGKSILIDALALALGGRADSGLIREGCEQASVLARFRLSPGHPLLSWLGEQELALDGEELFLRRVLSNQGRSRAFVNQVAVPLAVLAQAGAQLVDIHGQYELQSLLQAPGHLRILDAYAVHDTLVAEVRRSAEAWRRCRDERADLEARGGGAEARRVFLGHQLEELEAAGVGVGELAELVTHRARLANATRLALAVEGGLGLLADGQGAVGDGLSRAAGLLEGAGAMDPELATIAEALRSLHYELTDRVESLRRYQEGLSVDPVALERLDERLDLLRRLSRKHQCEADRLPELVETLRRELAAMDGLEENLRRLTEALARAGDRYRERAALLGRSRAEAAGRLTREVMVELGDLHMGNTRFAVTLTVEAGDPRPQGEERVAFEVSTNPGESLKPLKLVASGGELARLMLAMKCALADAVPVTTLIFDEVDVGVGGRVATSIGQKLRRLASGRQVLAITHQPQVAAWGEGHLRVEKGFHGGRARVEIVPLDDGGREEELARMLAGETVTDPARENARELLAAARETEFFPNSGESG